MSVYVVFYSCTVVSRSIMMLTLVRCDVKYTINPACG